MPLSNLLFWCLVHTGNMASTDGWFAIGYKPSYPLPVVFWLQPISIGLRASLCGLEMIPIAFQIITLYFLWRLFTAYQQDEIFSVKNTRLIRYVGIVMLLWQLLRPIYDMVFSFIMSAALPGQRYIALSFGNHDAAHIITAIMIIIIATVMQYGLSLDEEQQLTV